MADTWLDKPHVTINGVNYSALVRRLGLTYGREPVEKTAGSDGMRISLSGLRNLRVELEMKEEFASLDTNFFTLIESGASFAVVIRPDKDAAISAANPEYQIAAMIFDGPIPLISGGVGELLTKSFALVPYTGGASAIVRDVTP